MNKGIFYTSLSALLYGSIGYFGIRIINLGMNINSMLLWRFIFSCLLLLPVILYLILKNKYLLTNKYIILTKLSLLGAFQSISTACYFKASSLIGSGLSMVLFFSYPIFVIGFSYLLKKTPLSRHTLGSLALIIIGCAMIAHGGLQAELNIKGFGLALFSGLFYSFYMFFSKELSEEVSSLFATFSVCFGAMIAFLLYSLFTHTLSWPQSTKALLLITLFALVGTVLPVLFLLVGMRYLSANTASIISVLEPVAVLLVGAFILHEHVAIIQGLGAMVLLSATFLISKKPDQEPCLAQSYALEHPGHKEESQSPI